MAETDSYAQRLEQFFREVPDLPPEVLEGGRAEPSVDDTQFWQELRDSLRRTLGPPRVQSLRHDLQAVLDAWDEDTAAQLTDESHRGEIRVELRGYREQLLRWEPDRGDAYERLVVIEEALAAILKARNGSTSGTHAEVEAPRLADKHNALLQLVIWLETLV
jgi:hypothetical protein